VSIKLCKACLKKLQTVAARGGRAGSRLDKVRASKLAARARIKKAKTLTFDGQTLRVSQWAKKTGISKKTLYRRIDEGLDDAAILYPRE
jgi:transcriptional regulator of acetoin/glycerol metabolism